MVLLRLVRPHACFWNTHIGTEKVWIRQLCNAFSTFSLVAAALRQWAKVRVFFTVGNELTFYVCFATVDSWRIFVMPVQIELNSLFWEQLEGSCLLVLAIPIWAPRINSPGFGLIYFSSMVFAIQNHFGLLICRIIAIHVCLNWTT